MGIITVNITVNNIGADTGPFDIYDNYTGLLIVNVTKQELATGVTIDIDDAATQITVLSKGICNNNLIVPITTFPLSPTPSPTPSISITQTPSITPSISLTPSESPSTTPSVSVSPSIIITRTPSVTPSISISPTVTPSISISNTVSVTPTVTVSNTPTTSVSSTPSVTPSISISPTVTPSATPGASISISRTPSVTPTVTRTPTVTPTPSSFPTLFLGLSTVGANDACTNGELPGYTWILGNRSDTSLCDTSFVRNTSSSILNSISIGNFFWLRQGSSTRKFQVDLFSFGEFAGEVYGQPVESCATCVSVTPTPSISISRTPSVTPTRTPSTTPPCCTYYDLNISSDDTDNAVGNTFYNNGVVYVNYTDCYDTAQSLALGAGTYINQICVKPFTTVNLIYYALDNPVVASVSTAIQQGCCSPYPPPSASPSPSISVSKTPTPSVTAGISVTPTPSVTRTPSATPAAPTAFTFTNTFVNTSLLDCYGDGSLAVITYFVYEIILKDNCTNLNNLEAQSTQNFVVSIQCSNGTITDNISIIPGNVSYSNTYESENGCLGTYCDAVLTSAPGTLTQC